MDHVDNSTNEPPVPYLDKTACLYLFAHNLQDLYQIKLHLMEYLPLMSAKALTLPLKQSIIRSGVNFSAEVLRMEFIFKMLKYIPGDKDHEADRYLDFKGYIMECTKGPKSYQTDFAFINHLIMLDGMQISAHKVLRKLARYIKEPHIHAFLKQNMEASELNKRILLTLADTYLAS